MIEQRILDALNEAPAGKFDLADALDEKPDRIANALRKLVAANEIELAPQKRGAGLYRAKVETTKIKPPRAPGVVVSNPWDPTKNAKPDWLRRGEA